MHEMGHVLGYDDHTAADDLMSATLSLGVRRTLASRSCLERTV
jgi:hypothetical protein